MPEIAMVKQHARSLHIIADKRLSPSNYILYSILSRGGSGKAYSKESLFKFWHVKFNSIIVRFCYDTFLCLESPISPRVLSDLLHLSQIQLYLYVTLAVDR